MNDVMSPVAFKWLLTALTGVLATAWLIYDTRNLIVTRNADRTDAVVRDKHFGYVIGILIGIVGVLGCLRFHDVV
jgi:ABC-type nickel/cobalt efflux system permease component RcnA